MRRRRLPCAMALSAVVLLLGLPAAALSPVAVHDADSSSIPDYVHSAQLEQSAREEPSIVLERSQPSVDEGSIRRDALDFVKSRLFQRTAWSYAAITVAISPLVEPSGVAKLLSTLRIPDVVHSLVLAPCRQLWKLRDNYEFACLMAHEAITGVTADILAQSIEIHKASNEAPSETDTAAEETKGQESDGGDDASTRNARADNSRELQPSKLHWQRVARSTVVSLLSDDLPFLVWSKYVWMHTERFAEAVRSSGLPRPLVRALTNPLSLTLGKTALTQLVYETASDSAYLAMQVQHVYSLFRSSY